MRLIVTIPAYNEENSLGSVIGEIPNKIEGIDEILISVSHCHAYATATAIGVRHEPGSLANPPAK